MLIVSHANSDLGVISKYRNASQDDGLLRRVYNNGKIQLAMLFVWTMCFGVRMCSVCFMRRRLVADSTATRSWSEQPMALSLEDIGWSLVDAFDCLSTHWDTAISAPPNAETIVAGHRNGGIWVRRNIESRIAVMMGDMLAISAMECNKVWEVRRWMTRFCGHINRSTH